MDERGENYVKRRVSLLVYGTAGLLCLFSLTALRARAESDEDDDRDGLSDARELELGTDPHRMDTDGDYLTDGAEVARGTDPRSADTDRDGLPDYSELFVHGTNPRLKDTDEGGSIDGEEVLVDGTDPVNAQDDHLDSDDDGLPNERERVLGTDPFMSDSDHDLLSDGAEDKNHDAKRSDDETDPKRADTDGDGLSDGVEVLVYHSDPLERDSDADGVVDGDEHALRAEGADCLDPALPDSDQDGLSDGEELMQAPQSDPCRADSDGDGIYDAVERSDGTGPRDRRAFKPDADGDHLSDDYESKQSLTDVTAADSDADGLSDSEELFPLLDKRKTDARDADTDDDGLLDGSESRIVGERLRPSTDPRLADTDADGLLDGQELGLTSPELSPRDASATKLETFRVDGDPGSKTDPLFVDSDGDGLADGAEDADHDGLRDATETDPLDPDSDGDGLDDGWEARYASIRESCANPLDAADATSDPDGDDLSNRQEYASTLLTSAGMREISTNPCARDTDADGIDDPTELHSGYGEGQSDPTSPDTDGDGLSDGLEDRDRDGRWLPDQETDPTRVDTDGDRLPDGREDADADGEIDSAETDPLRSDSDGDGVEDGSERELFGTDPTASDTDGDGLPDGLELSMFGDADPVTSTDPQRADTDEDGILDGVEDANHDGAEDADETHPRRADSDGDLLSDGVEDSDYDGVFDPGRGESDPRKFDTDGAGVDDGTEVNTDHTDPNNPDDDLTADPDADGLITRVELRLLTNPLAADSDGDWISDGEEVGEDPEAPADFDADGAIDALDDDSDADAVADAIETGDEDLETPVPDSDGDGTNDVRDRDSDNGGVPDGTEYNRHHTDRLDPSDDGRGWFEEGSRVRGSGCAVSAPGGRGAPWWLFGLLFVLVSRRRGRLRLSVSLWLLYALPVSAVRAQVHPDARKTAIDGSPYRLNPSGDTLLATSLPGVLPHLRWQARLGVQHFADSIVIADADGHKTRSILDNRQQLELAAAVGLFDWLELSAHWAVAIHQSATLPGAGLGDTDAFGVTHPILHPKLALLRNPDSPLRIGLEAPVTLGLWKPQAYMGRDGVSVRPAALVSWLGSTLTAALSVGVDLLPSARINRTRDGSRLVYAAAVQYPAQSAPWQVTLEWSASHRFGDLWNPDEQTGQLALGFGYRISPGWTLHVMVAAGLLGGIGQPQHRVLASTAYRPPAAPPATNAAITRKPTRPAIGLETPRPVETAQTTPTFEAAASPPPSAAVPEQAAPLPAATEPAPTAAESALPPTAANPPTRAFETLSPEERIREERQALAQRIYFADAGSGFVEESTGQLDRLVAVLDATPGLYVRIEGHSDRLDDNGAYRALSLRRARAVQQYLLAHSRDPRGLAMRISAVSVAGEPAVDAHDTEAGRANGYVSFSVFGRGQ